MLTEFAVLLLVFMLAAILTVYNHRQAAALRGIESLVADFVALQIRDRRDKVTQELALDPLAWLSQQASAGLEEPVVVTEVLRVVREAYAAELRTESGRNRLVVSSLPRADLLRYDRRLRARGGKSAAQRVESFAANPLLGKSRWGVTLIERSMAAPDVSEFFDLEAGYVAERLGLAWGQPTRLWFYLVG